MKPQHLQQPKFSYVMNNIKENYAPIISLAFVMIYLLTVIGLSPGGSSTVHIYTQTIHRTTQNKQYTKQHNNLGECGPCPVLASYTLAFALQLRKKHGKTSVRVAASKNTYRKPWTKFIPMLAEYLVTENLYNW